MAKTVTNSPLPLHLHDSSLTSAFGLRGSGAGSREASPWSKFLSPSLFALEAGQRSSPLPSVLPASPLRQAQNPPSLYTHAREINPFEQSFSHLRPGALPGSGTEAESQDASGQGGVAGLRAPKRKRAMSSPALFTPGGTGEFIGDSVKEAFLHQAKRPSLRLAAQAGLPEHMASALSVVPSESTMSIRSSTTNSFDETTAGSSLLRHRRGGSLHTLSLSPDTSIAPSPRSPKLSSPFPPSAAAFAHFQPEPMPFSMPALAASVTPFADPSLFATSTVAPSAFSAAAAAPIPVTTFEPVGVLQPPIPVDPQFAFPPHDPFSVAASSLQPFPPAAIPPMPVPFSLAPTAGGLVGNASPVVEPGLGFSYPPVPATIPVHAPPVIAHIPVASASIPVPSTSQAPPPPPPAKKPAAPKAPPPPVEIGPDGQPLPKPKPPGKKRGRKPKNWDATLERPIELEPEEQERQRKQALERNRIAASKSRRRKKERVEFLEGAATELCSRNIALQAECRNLLAEVHSLRTYLTQAHPPGCSCVHIQGYLAREADGGGIPAIMYGAGASLDRDYARVPKWGQDDDVFQGIVIDDAPPLEGAAGAAKGKKAKQAAEQAAKGQQGGGAGSSAQGGVLMKASGSAQGPRDATEEPSSEEEEESEEETIELKSRRARGIAARNKA